MNQPLFVYQNQRLNIFIKNNYQEIYLIFIEKQEFIYKINYKKTKSKRFKDFKKSFQIIKKENNFEKEHIIINKVTLYGNLYNA